MMKAAWIADLAGSYGTIQHQQILDKVAKYGLTRIYLDARFAKSSDFDYLRSKGIECGLYGVSNWVANSTLLASTLSDALARTNSVTKQCAVMVDIEQHDPQYVLDWLKTWRSLRPTRATEWTLEPFQAGWFTPDLINAIRTDPNLKVVGQLYFGNMYPCSETAVRDDLEAALGPERVSVFYDAKNGAPARMDGYLFTLERLPL